MQMFKLGISNRKKSNTYHEHSLETTFRLHCLHILKHKFRTEEEISKQNDDDFYKI